MTSCIWLRIKGPAILFQSRLGISFLLGLGCWISGVADASAQERCGTVAYEKMIHGTRPGHETETQFEDWIRAKIAANKNKTTGTNRVQDLSYTIPVVVHIIHNGEPLGTGTNISDAQIASQIQVLNDDYKRLNADAANTPSEFAPFAGSIDITFVLAKQDPEGVATNGITRTLGTKTSWTIADNSTVKALSYWPAENYLNIWVMNLTGGLIGIAHLPVSSQLQGLEDSSTDRLTDGVMINYRDFGSGGSFVLDAAYNKGRTATHEIGHFFGLRHIWGDGNCADDYVADTPSQPSSTSGCPSGPVGVSVPVTCSGNTHNKMYQNYMDYTKDVCMNLFTKNHIDRMVVILANSPRRNSLLTSPGAQNPTPAANDAGVKQILAPQASVCKSNIVPQIEIRNYGSNTVSSVQVQASVNGSPVETKTFSVNLAPLNAETVAFSNLMNFTAGSSQTVSFQILQTNGVTDGKPSNDSMSVTVSVPASTALPILESFNSLPSGWQIVNPDGQITWANVTAPDANASNKAMYINFNDYQDDGVLDWLITPSFILSNPATSQLKFNRAYAQFPGESGDELFVYALPSCSRDLSQAILLYDASGTTLATAGTTSSPFTPSSASQWQTQVKSLSTLSSATSYQIAFVAKNGYGNNLYVDAVIVSDQEVNDVGITQVVSPGLVHCLNSPSIKISLKNYSTAVITNFDVVRTLNGGAPTTQTITVNLDLDEQKTITLNPVTLKPGENNLVITINKPNGLPDSSPSNNTLAFNSYLDQSTDAAPLRLTFDNPVEVPWIMATPQTNAQDWETVSTPKKTSVAYKAFTNTALGEESWLVSPILDLSQYTQQNLFFDLSYALKYPREDRLRVIASTDCGVTYSKVLFDESGSVFQDSTLLSEWLPPSDKYWRREVLSLDSISGIKNVRLAFVAVNANGNNIYLDNIEIFAGKDPSPPVSNLSYQLYYPTRFSQYDIALTFTLEQKKDVRLQIFSVMGQMIADSALPDTLNQTYYFDLSNQSAGIYLFRVQIDDQVSTTKVFIGH